MGAKPDFEKMVPSKYMQSGFNMKKPHINYLLKIKTINLFM